MEEYPLTYQYQMQPQEKRLLSILNLCIGIGVALCAWFIFLAIAGYGHVAIASTPADATVTINGHHITTATVKMRPGSYQINVTSPTITPYQETLHISLFTTTQFKPTLKPRDADSVASSTLGAVPGSTLVPRFGTVKYLPDNWIAGALTPDGTILALHYDQAHKQWVIAYCSAPGYPQDVTSTPSAVGAYIQSLLAARNDA